MPSVVQRLIRLNSPEIFPRPWLIAMLQEDGLGHNIPPRFPAHGVSHKAELLFSHWTGNISLEKQSSSPPVLLNVCTNLKRSRTPEGHDREMDQLHPRKKRRLRHDLVTSKLSKPYATPPTFIAVKKPLREGVWARQRISGRDLVRKAAIFNSLATRQRTNGLRGVNNGQSTYQASLVE